MELDIYVYTKIIGKEIFFNFKVKFTIYSWNIPLKLIFLV